MALDRAVQLRVEAGESPPTLRLYRWERPTVTAGRFQRAQTIDTEACARLGVDVVRRFTGGRGVLHHDEVTYSVVARASDGGLPSGVAASYRYLCGALAASYRRLGVPAQLTERDGAASPTGACYLQTTRADLTLDGSKLSGSAQVWAGSTLLQHGSFVIDRDAALEAAVFRLSEVEAEHLASVTATIVGATSLRPSDAEIAAAVRAGFEEALGVVFEPGTFTDEETALAESLLPEVAFPGERRGVRP